MMEQQRKNEKGAEMLREIGFWKFVTAEGVLKVEVERTTFQAYGKRRIQTNIEKYRFIGKTEKM